MKRFQSHLTRIPVDIDREDFALVELSGKERDKYTQSMSKRMRYNAKGQPAGLKSFDGLQASLLMKTLHRAELDRTNTDDVKVVEIHDLVSQEEIQGWGSKMQTELFQDAQELCGMDDDEDDEEDAAKND
jgi:hypothetical protein